MKERIIIFIILLTALCLAAGCSRWFEKETSAAVTDTAENSSEKGAESLPMETTESPQTSQSAGESTVQSLPMSETESWNETVSDYSSEGGPYETTEDTAYHPPVPELDYLKGLEIPEYSGKAYIVINGNVPFFEKPAKDETEAYETYYDLDVLGRCTLADACVGTEIMPTEKRGEISSVRPTGWHVSLYDKNLVDGESLYNRCHLIAYTLTAENANKYNLVTGTRYFNTAGMNSFENMVADYIRETKRHVRYRVTPVWTGDNLICDGVVMEGWSVEDGGEDICYCIYAYNVQPGIEIDYATGDNWLSGETPAVPTTTQPPTEEVDTIGDYVLNTKTKRFHLPTCEGAITMNEKNRQEYHGSRNQLLIDGYKPCGGCQP